MGGWLWLFHPTRPPDCSRPRPHRYPSISSMSRSGAASRWRARVRPPSPQPPPFAVLSRPTGSGGSLGLRPPCEQVVRIAAEEEAAKRETAMATVPTSLRGLAPVLLPMASRCSQGVLVHEFPGLLMASPSQT
ncbi:hypothetical protein C8Q74DRAFT_1213043 [Fomes fomentarius]|nr:hypothetical protein C8Q74DRAFT_1213043 [Fomes fomentarius]